MSLDRLRHLAGACALTFAALGPAAPAGAEITIAETEENKVSFYGFLKLDAVYQTDGMNSLVAPRFATGGDGATHFTAMHSRFGIRWAGPEVAGGLKLGGVVEWDLFDNSRNQMKFRDRLVAFTLSKDQSTWMFGQHWDVFSPLNVTTSMTNGNLWQTGNLGFRRAQVRYTYSGPAAEFAVSANDPTTAGATASQTPILESRIGFQFAGRGKVGLSGAYGQDERTVGGGSEDFDIAGISLDWIVPLGDSFTWKGEAATGENLGVFLSRSGVAENTHTGVLEAQEVTAFWTQVVYSGGSRTAWLGFAAEELDDAALPAATFETTRMAFAGVRFQVAGKATIGIEAATFTSELPNGDEVESQQGLLSAQYTF